MAFFAPTNGASEHESQYAAFTGLAGPSTSTGARRGTRTGTGAGTTNETDDPQFDIFEWHPRYQSCQRYFLDHAQHSAPVQAVAAFTNICLPYQWSPNPVIGFASVSPASPNRAAGSGLGFTPPLRFGGGSSPAQPGPANTWVSLIPYLRRLVATGLDFPGVLHGFFGDDWAKGVGPLHEQERRNYLFAAKNGGWASVKKEYDIAPHETVPFLRPLQGALDAEIEAAEKTWSEWLAMEDWMLGPRAPESMSEPPPSRSRMPR
ncbi:MAG: hypothetical protein M1819_005064 [Sarea resinae]|nr:MAG: hypothetical protein M1819_005064 [Sarea resinae]